MVLGDLLSLRWSLCYGERRFTSDERHLCSAECHLPGVDRADPQAKRSDVLALLDTGAYQEVAPSNFNAMPRPARIRVNGDQTAWIRIVCSGRSRLCR
jgi:hypothetical protein